MKKKWFTLIELIISITIIWALVVLMFKTYSHITNISIKIENEKNVNNELLYLSQTLQNLSDKYDINLNKYSNLTDTKWLTWTLYLTWIDNISIYATWDWCNLTDLTKIKNKYCWVQMKKNEYLIDITDKDKVFLKNLNFKLIPFTWNTINTESKNIYHKWFWIFTESYTKKYIATKWAFNIKVPLQMFFNIRRY